MKALLRLGVLRNHNQQSCLNALEIVFIPGYPSCSPKQLFEAMDGSFCCARYGQQDPDEPTAPPTPSSKSVPHMTRKDILCFVCTQPQMPDLLSKTLWSAKLQIFNDFHLFSPSQGSPKWVSLQVPIGLLALLDLLCPFATGQIFCPAGPLLHECRARA